LSRNTSGTPFLTASKTFIVKKEVMTFATEEGPVEVEITIHPSNDHVQLTVSPISPKLLDQYGTQVFHKFSGKPLQTAFPETSPGKQDYYRALKHAVSAYAARWKEYA
jgi:hypothetical protein